MNGWIKLYRQLQDCPIWYGERFSKGQAWVDLLMLANHSDKKIMFNRDFITVQRGQYLTSMVKLSEKWKWNRKTVSSFLKLLENDNMITKVTDNTKTLITIVNYGIYQSENEIVGQPITQPNGQLNGQPSTQPIGQQLDSQTDNPLDTNKNDKNIKNEEEREESKNEKKDTHLSERKQIIEYLNQKLGTRYRHGSDINKKYINTRLNEGYTVDDFYEVIDKKCSEWQGTEREKYLRPETLFGNKFESYLNQKIVKEKGQTTQMLEQHYSMVDDWVRRKEMEAESNEF